MAAAIAVIGAGNGGKATAADLALQGVRVRLCELPEFGASLSCLGDPPRLRATGAVEGVAELEMATTDLAAAVGADGGVGLIIVCTQAVTHERVAHDLAPLVGPEQTIVISPGSTGGSLEFAHVFRASGVMVYPTFVEFSTLPYGCRADGAQVTVELKLGRPARYASFPGQSLGRIAPLLETWFPCLVPAEDVLEVGLNNANPVIHPPIALLNASRIENDGASMQFYQDGVSPASARLIQKLDEERMLLLRACGYSAQAEPETSRSQGYCASTDYLECYRHGPVFAAFSAPDTLDHRYLHEDCGLGLVMFCSIGRKAGVPTPVCEAVVRFASAVANRDYLGEGRRTLESLGLGDLSLEHLKSHLQTGETVK